MRTPSLLTITLGTLFWALLAGPIGAQKPPGAADPGVADIRAARERWAGMDAAEREAVLERYQAFEAMNPEEREALRHRAEHVRALRARVREHLPAPTREELDRLPPPERACLMREHVRGELGAIGRGFRGELPLELRSELERARPERWSNILRERGRRDREHGLDRLLVHFAAELGIESDELLRVRALPPPEREAVVLDWTRDSLVRKVEERFAALGELPPGIDEARWRELLVLPPDAFLTELRRLTGFGAFSPRRNSPGKGGGHGRGGGPPGRGGPPFGRPPETPGAAPERSFLDPFSLDPASSSGIADLHGLRELLRPRLEETLALRELPPGERQRELAEMIRARVLAHLEQTGLFAEELPALRELGESAFLDRMRELVHQNARTILRRGGRWHGGEEGESRRPRRGER